MGRRKGKSILGMVARELLVELPKVGFQQICGTTPKRRKRNPGKTVYVTIERHHHHHHWHKPEIKK